MTKANNQTIGGLIFESMNRDVIIDNELWVKERIATVMQNFKSTNFLTKDYKVIVPWLNAYTAFTAPGEFVFFSRKLFQDCPTEEMVAFVIAHEIAHHELGHLDVFPEFVAEGIAANISMIRAVMHRILEARLYGPEQEIEADKAAIELCYLSGYDPFKCLKLFDRLEKTAMDNRDFGAVFGPDEADDELDPDAPLSTKMKIWLYQRKRGYLPIRDRRHALIKHVHIFKSSEA